MSATPAAFNAGANNNGVIISSTKDDIMAPNAAPIITATARFKTFPLNTNSLNSFYKLIIVRLIIKIIFINRKIRKLITAPLQKFNIEQQ